MDTQRICRRYDYIYGAYYPAPTVDEKNIIKGKVQASVPFSELKTKQKPLSEIKRQALRKKRK